MNTSQDMFTGIVGKQNIPYRPTEQQAAYSMSAKKLQEKKGISKPSNIKRAAKSVANLNEEKTGVVESFNKQDATTSMVSTAGGGGSASDIVSTGLMASGNPYAIAGGLALKTISGIAERKRKEKAQNAENQYRHTQNVANLVSRLGQGIGNTGM